MSTFDNIRRLFDQEHRQSWETAFSNLPIFRDNNVRVVATVPEKVLASPSHPDLPGVSAQVLFSDETDTPRISLDFYETSEGVIVGVTLYLGESPVAGGFSKIQDVDTWIEGQAKETARYLGKHIKRASKEFGDLKTRKL